MSNFESLENKNFYSLKRLVIYLEDPQTTFSALLCMKTNKKKFKRFTKNANFYGLKRLVFI